MAQIPNDDRPGKYIFQGSLSQIIDNETHPLHNTYIEALATIKQPCSHGPVILGNNPKDVFDEQTMEEVERYHQAHQIPIMDNMCGDFSRDYQLYAFLGSGCKPNLPIFQSHQSAMNSSPSPSLSLNILKTHF
jgi:hypothetical protein